MVGDAGLGKSRLVAEIVRTLRAAGHRVAFGEAQAFGRNTSYLIWREPLMSVSGDTFISDLTLADFEIFDYVLAMDRENREILASLCPAGYEERLSLFLDYAPDLGIEEVPDPYWGGEQGFEQVFDMLEAASLGLLEEIRSRL